MSRPQRCRSAQTQLSRSRKSLHFLGPADPDHLHPASLYYLRPGQLLRLLTRQLFSYPITNDLSDKCSAFTPIPDVAIEIPTLGNGGISEDCCVYTIRLRGDVCWDTTPPREVTSHDFLRAMKCLANPLVSSGVLPYFTSTIQGMHEHCEAYNAQFSGKRPSAQEIAIFQASRDISGLLCPDDRTLVITLKQPAGDFINLLAMGFVSAVPREFDDLLPDDERLRRSFISCGPYRMRCSPDTKELQLEPNPSWSQRSDPIRQQYFESIYVHLLNESDALARQKIASGQVGPAWPFTIVSWGDPQESHGAFPTNYPAFALNPYLVFNLHSPNQGCAARNLKIRQAIAYAIDRVAVGEIFNRLPGVATRPLHSTIPPGNRGYCGFDPYPTVDARGNQAEARQLVHEAGYAEGLSLIAAVRDNPLHLDVMRSVARDLQACGISLILRKYGQSEYYGRLLMDPANAKAGLWDIAEVGWTPDWFGNNGRAVTMQILKSSEAQGTTNYGCYSSPIVDELIDRALEELDSVRAHDLWHKVDIEVMKDLPIIPILAFACQCCAARTGTGWGSWIPRHHCWVETAPPG
ncbi:peptide/nickel transport system substrate-binding protein [Bradyrhizobium japonicum]